MMFAGMLGLFSVGTLACMPAGTAAMDSLEAVYQRGKTYQAFLAGADSRREMWLRNSAKGKVDAEALRLGRSLGAGWRLLVVLEDACGDSANTIPYVASLVDSLGGKVEMRLVNSTEGRWVMERYRTRDGRAATPTIVLLNPEGEMAGCWVERPAPLAAWERAESSKLSQQEFVRQKFAWYDRDGGAETQREVVAMVARAAPGTACGGNAP
jgi:hypothetical protein